MGERILVAIEDATTGTTALDHTVALARRTGAEVHVLHVNPRLIGGRGHTLLTPGDAESLVAQAVEQLRSAGIETTGSVICTSSMVVADTIARTAVALGCSLIVVGSRRRRGPWRLFGHGIRERLISRSHLPVITAPAPLRPSRRAQAVDYAELERALAGATGARPARP